MKPTPILSLSSAESAPPALASGALIGPNAVTRISQAMESLGYGPSVRTIFAVADDSQWLENPPTRMIDQMSAARLHRAVRDLFPIADAHKILAEAGRLTADYLLANRIPRLFQRLLPWLPRRWAEKLFLAAIGRHAWTFVGSGRFSATVGDPTMIEIRHNPLCSGERRPGAVCVWHAAVFRRLFGELISPAARVDEITCEARGDSACRFHLTWTAAEPGLGSGEGRGS